MKLHHIGVACHNIEKSIEYIKKTHLVKAISETVFDELQNASVCLLEIDGSPNIELVSGSAVEHILAQHGDTPYHICYEVTDLARAIKQYQLNNSYMIVEPRPAKLFAGRLVTFFQTPMGMIELLEKESSKQSKKILQKYYKNATHVDALICSSFTPDMILEPLQILTSKLKSNLKFTFCQSYQVIPMLLNPNSSLAKNTLGINILLIKCSDFPENTIDELVLSIKSLSARSLTPLIIVLCPDRSSNNKKFELLIKKSFLNTRSIYILDSEFIRNNGFTNTSLDPVSNKIAQIPYNQTGYNVLALSIMRACSAINRQPYKVIVVDCDNTLWTGVCAEVGYKGIKIHQKNLALQKFLIDQFNQGMLLCLCSKNNENDVLEVFTNRDDMLIKLEHIIDKKINWNKKSENIYQLALKLNLNLDSFIFIDDNIVECNEVESALPQVLTIHLPNNDNAINTLLKRIWAFDHFKISEEDKKRQQYYKTNIKFNIAKKDFGDIKKFIAGLNICINMHSVDKNHIIRASQLTYRVNQFNFTSIKWTEKDITLHKEKGMNISIIEISDRFGHYGLSGLVAYLSIDNMMCIKAFLLSCRVLGRGVEHKITSELANLANTLGLEVIKFEFKNTEKNKPAQQFIESIKYFKKSNHCYYCYTTDLQNLEYESINDNNSPNKLYRSVQSTEEDRVNLNKVIMNIATNNFSFKNKTSLKTINTTFYADDADRDLINIWQEILSKNQISITDNFFDLGGNSLHAVQILSRIYRQFNVRLSLQNIFNYPTIQQLKHCIFKTTGDSFIELSKTSSTTFSYEKNYPLSYSQHHLWFINKLLPGNYAYNMPLALNLHGDLNIEALQYAFEQLINKHSVFRTSFHENKGEPYQIIHQTGKPDFKVIDVQNDNHMVINKLLLDEEHEPFNLQTAPILRIRLLHFSKNQYLLLITTHHIIFDGWSYALMNKDIEKYYRQFLSNRKTKTTSDNFAYLNLVTTREKTREDGAYNKQIKFWRNYLVNTPLLNLPTDYPKNNTVSFEGKYFQFPISKTIVDRIKLFLKKYQLSCYSLLLSVYILQMAEYSNQHDFTIGTVSAGRTSSESENIIGFFVNTLIIRAKIKKIISFIEFVRVNQQAILEVLSNQDVPFEQILKECFKHNHGYRGNMIESMFIFQNTNNTLLNLPDIKINKFKQGYDIARFNIIMELEENNTSLMGGIYYKTHLYNEKTIIAMSKKFIRLLELAVTNPNQPIQNWCGEAILTYV